MQESALPIYHMVHTYTYIFMIITMFTGFIACHYYFRKYQPNFGYVKLIVTCILAQAAMIAIALIFPAAFQIEIYGSILMATFVCVYYRYRQKVGGEW